MLWQFHVCVQACIWSFHEPSKKLGCCYSCQFVSWDLDLLACTNHRCFGWSLDSQIGSDPVTTYTTHIILVLLTSSLHVIFRPNNVDACVQSDNAGCLNSLFLASSTTCICYARNFPFQFCFLGGKLVPMSENHPSIAIPCYKEGFSLTWQKFNLINRTGEVMICCWDAFNCLTRNLWFNHNGYIGSPFGLGLSCQLWVGLKMFKILPSIHDDPHDQSFTTHSVVEVFLLKILR